MTDRTKPLPRTQRRLEGRELNRGLQKGRGSETNQRKDNVKNVSIGLIRPFSWIGIFENSKLAALINVDTIINM